MYFYMPRNVELAIDVKISSSIKHERMRDGIETKRKRERKRHYIS